MKNLIAPEMLAEFRKKPVEMEKVVAYLDAHPDVTAATLCKLIDIPVQRLYNWRNDVKKNASVPQSSRRTEFTVVPVATGGKYSPEDKLALMKQYDKLDGPGRTKLLREYALYQSDIRRWQEAADQAALESLGKRKTRSDKQPAEMKLVESLKKDLLVRDRKIEKLQTLVTIQKKLSVLLDEGEST